MNREAINRKSKILLGVMQIQNAMPWTLPAVEFPLAFRNLTKWTSFLDLDLIRFLPVACMFEVSYFMSLLVATMFPLAVAVLIFLIGGLRIFCAKTQERAAEIRNATFSWFLLLTYVVFPNAPSRARSPLIALRPSGVRVRRCPRRLGGVR